MKKLLVLFLLLSPLGSKANELSQGFYICVKSAVGQNGQLGSNVNSAISAVEIDEGSAAAVFEAGVAPVVVSAPASKCTNADGTEGVCSAALAKLPNGTFRVVEAGPHNGCNGRRHYAEPISR